MACPCSIWGPAVVPKTQDSGDTAATEVGVKFQVDTFGYVTGIRFYKATGNTGTHVGNLWSCERAAAGHRHLHRRDRVRLAAGQLLPARRDQPEHHLRRVLLRSEGPLLGRQRLLLPDPHARANPTIGNVDSAPLHALRNNGTVDNGVFAARGQQRVPDQHQQRRELLGGSRLHAADLHPPPGQVGNVTATAGYASATVTWSAPTTGDPATAYTITPYIGSTAQTPTTVTGKPAPTTATHLRAHERHDVHVHGHCLEPGRHRPGVGERPTR